MREIKLSTTITPTKNRYWILILRDAEAAGLEMMGNDMKPALEKARVCIAMFLVKIYICKGYCNLPIDVFFARIQGMSATMMPLFTF